MRCACPQQCNRSADLPAPALYLVTQIDRVRSSVSQPNCASTTTAAYAGDEWGGYVPTTATVATTTTAATTAATHTHFLSPSPSRQRPARPGSRRGNEWWPQYASPPRTGPLNKQELFSGLTHAAPPPVEDAELVQAESFCLKIAPRGRYYFMFERRAGRVRVGEDTSFCNLREHPLGRPLSSRLLPTFVCLDVYNGRTLVFDPGGLHDESEKTTGG